MKQLVLSLSLFVIFLSYASAAEKIYFVKIVDHEKYDSAQILNDEKMKAIVKKAALEKKLWPKALALAEKEWKANEELKGSKFPRLCGAPMKVTPGRPTTMEAAEKKMIRLQEKVNEELAISDEQRKQLDRAIKKNPGLAKKQEKEEAKMALYATAREMVEKHLEVLMAPAPEGE